MNKTTVDLLVVSYNTKDLLIRLLDTLHDDWKPNIWRLHIQDNGSEDGTAEYLYDNFDKYNIDRLYSTGNMGYAKAINNLASKGASPYMAALNADVWLTTSDVQQMAEYMDTDDKIAVSSPKQMNENNKIVHGGIVGRNNRPQHRGWMEPDQNDTKYKDIKDCVTVSGSAYFMKRSVWDEAISYEPFDKFNREYFGYPPRGGFLETPHYWEETFYSYLVRHMGYRVTYNGNVTVGHTWHASSKVGTGHDRPENVAKARTIFRNACDYIGIERD